MKEGHKVVVCAAYSEYQGDQGVITEAPYSSDLPYTVAFADGTEDYFYDDELEVVQ